MPQYAKQVEESQLLATRGGSFHHQLAFGEALLTGAKGSC